MDRAISVNKKSKNIQLYQNLIILIMLFAPFTSLRLFRIGITESMSLLLFLFVLISKYKLKLDNKDTFIFTKFWILYFLTSGIGLFYNYIIMPSTSGTVNGMIFDTLSYLVVFLTCLSLEMIIYNKREINIEHIFHRIFIYSSLILFILFILSRFTDSILGFDLLDRSGNFRPLADNIHHVGMFIGPLPFIGLYFFKSTHKLTPKFLYFFLIISNIIVVFNVGSDKAVLGFYMGAIIVTISFFFKKINGYDKNYLYPLSVIILLVIVLVNFDNIYGSMISAFAEADGEGARQSLYTTAFYQSTESPLFGLGPGQHISWPGIGFADTHSTFLTALLQSGIIGLCLFIILLIKTFNKFKLSVYFLAASSSILIYITGGDILRRLPIWIYLILFYYGILLKIRDQEKNYTSNL